MEERTDSKVLGRREFLWGTGALGLGTFAGGSTYGAAAFTPGAIAGVLANTCVLTPSEAEGPFYRDLNAVRRDIREGQPGLDTTLVFRVVRASDCTPIQGAVVDIWHAEHLGVYSSFAGQGTHGQFWLRGEQVTDANGIAFFRTIFPGWYPGRVPHVHAKIFPDMTSELTTQFYFPNHVSDEVLALAPYDAHGPKPHTNQDDMYFHPETVFGVRKLARASLFPPAFAPIRRLLAGVTIAVV